MIRWLFALFIIALFASVIWWPGHFDAEHFAGLAQEEITRSLTLLPEFVHKVAVWIHDGILSLTGIDIFPGEANRSDKAMNDGFERLGNTPYWLAVKSLLTTALIRFTLAAAWFVLLLPLAAVTVADALVVRALRYESFACTHPTLYKAALLMPSATLCLAFLAILLPAPIPMVLPAVFYLVFLISLHVLVSHFHRFG